MTQGKQDTEARRLEELWSGQFGDAYVGRNANASNGRDAFWKTILTKYAPHSVCEVGCNIGGNLRWIAEILPPAFVWGIDVNETALGKLRAAVPGVKAVHATAKELPFADGQFDLVFTAGVLIHQPESSLKDVMSEVVRCSKRYVLCMEYFSPETVEVPYRGQEGALFKRDYGRLYAEAFPELRLLEKGHLDKDQGWDDVTYWLFEKSGDAR